MTNGTRREWGVNVTPRPLFTSGKDPVPIVQEAVWAPGPVWTGAENLAPTGIRSPDRPAHSQSLYRLSYRAHSWYIPLHYTPICYSIKTCENLIFFSYSVLWLCLYRCPTRYQTRHFFNNSKTNEDIATKQTHTTDIFLFISHTTNLLLFKFRCNIFVGVRIINP